jgi:hypothetical protein
VYIRCDPDDFNRVGAGAKLNMLSDRAGTPWIVPPEAVGQCFVNDQDGRPIFEIAIGKQAALPERNAHCWK